MCHPKKHEGLSELGQQMLQILVADRKAAANQAALEYADALIGGTATEIRVQLIGQAISATQREQEILKVAANQDRLTFEHFQNSIVKED